MKTIRSAVLVFGTIVPVYALTNYGGIRSPDSEIVFRVAQSLASTGSFHVSEELDWKGFGLAEGRDGKLYSIFGPAESVLCVPLVHVATWINSTKWYESDAVPFGLSHYVDDGLNDYLRGSTPADREPHALRFIVSFFNAIVTAVGAAVFFLIARALVRSSVSAYAATILYAFGTLASPYSGTFFSEPLATTFVLMSFYFMLVPAPGPEHRAGSPGSGRLLLAGTSLGVAAAAHISAILFLPFFAAYCGYRCYSRRAGKGYMAPFLAFVLGCTMVLLLLGYYNHIRFGSVLETGRTVGPDSHDELGYGRFVAPWAGLWGLLLSPGKSILLFCPAILLGLVAWRTFHRAYPSLSLTLASALLFRLVFVASRSDWHGGYSLGPRYLVMIIPFLVIPTAVWLDGRLSTRARAALGVWLPCTLVCVAQQLVFCVGEVFSFYHLTRAGYAENGIDILKDNRVYLSWETSPLLHLLQYETGPFLLQRAAMNNTALWSIGVLLAGCLLVLVFRRLPLRYGEPGP